MRRHARQAVKLIESHAQGNPDLCVEFRLSDQVIQLSLMAEDSKDNFRCQPGIARIQRGAFRSEKVRSPCSALHPQQHVKSDAARRRDRHYFYNRMLDL